MYKHFFSIPFVTFVCAAKCVMLARERGIIIIIRRVED